MIKQNNTNNSKQIEPSRKDPSVITSSKRYRVELNVVTRMTPSRIGLIKSFYPAGTRFMLKDNPTRSNEFTQLREGEWILTELLRED